MRKSLLNDLLTTCFEGGSNHWIDRIKVLDAIRDDRANYLIEVHPYDYDGPCRDVTPKTAAEAWSKLRAEYPKIAARITSEDYDADDADAFLQLICFDEIIFG